MDGIAGIRQDEVDPLILEEVAQDMDIVFDTVGGDTFLRAKHRAAACIRVLVEEGKMIPHIAAVLPLERFGEALDLSESGRTRGEIVLRIRP